MNDDDLVRRARTGDGGAFESLVDRHYAQCLRFAWRQLGNREDAEEAVQDAFVRAHRSLSNGVQPDRFHAWVMTIVVNRCRTYAARRRRRLAFLERLRWFGERPDEPVASAVDGAVDPEITRALQRLPARQREAFLLKHVEEMSYEDMSAVTGAGISALKMRVKRAGNALGRMLEAKRD
ncbi:MAG: RNA polymerase sigma factor [Gammaproteobacteria bacterium]